LAVRAPGPRGRRRRAGKVARAVAAPSDGAQRTGIELRRTERDLVVALGGRVLGDRGGQISADQRRRDRKSQGVFLHRSAFASKRLVSFCARRRKRRDRKMNDPRIPRRDGSPRNTSTPFGSIRDQFSFGSAGGQRPCTTTAP